MLQYDWWIRYIYFLLDILFEITIKQYIYTVININIFFFVELVIKTTFFTIMKVLTLVACILYLSASSLADVYFQEEFTGKLS